METGNEEYGTCVHRSLGLGKFSMESMDSGLSKTSNSKFGTKACGLFVSKGLFERGKLWRLMMENERDLSQVVPDFGQEASMRSSSNATKCF